MKQKITERYIRVFVVSIFLIIAVWLVLTYFFVFSNNVPDNTQPQYLVNSFEQYIDDDYHISNEGKEILKKSKLWAQIINDKGKVMESYNVPQEVQDSYNVFEITLYTMNSNTLGNQTLFISNFTENEQLGVIIGCDSSKVSKWNVKLNGGTKTAIALSLLILVFVFVIIGICAGLIFSKNISIPVNDIIEDINSLEADKEEMIQRKHNTMFQTVFDSINRLRARLRSADEERKNVEEQRREWISNISHDMKTPLTTIKGYAEIMSDECYEVTEEERHFYSEKIKNNVAVIENLIDDLNFGRLLKNGTIKLQKEEVNICSLLRECCNDITANYRGGKIRYDFSADSIYAVVDKRLMQRVFVNILCNALIHNNYGVDIVVKCREDEKVVIEICDDGKGMSEEELGKIFNRYYRGKSSKEVDGSGLGLAIAKEIVDAHGGNISVNSKLGEGTSFIIELYFVINRRLVI